MAQSKNTWSRFGIRTLLASVAVIACLLTAYQYRKQALKPDLSITAGDVAWATDHHIWKIDLSEQQNVYGVQIVVFEETGAKKRWICRAGGDSLIDTAKNSLVTVSLKCSDGTVNGKLKYMGGTTSFNVDNLLQGGSVAWAGVPVLNDNYYYIVSDSQTWGSGKQPFEKSSNKLAIELLRSPNF